MSTKTDRQQVLGVLEDNYTSDLSIHLYSTFLLRRINPNFPRHSWSYWPLRFADVPIPQDDFEDDIVNGYEKDIDDDVSALKRRVSNRKSRAEEATSLEDSTKEDEDTTIYNADVESESEQDEDDNNNEFENEDENLKRLLLRPITEITYLERTPNSKKLLVNSLSSIIQHKIHARIKELNISKNNLAITDDMASNPALVPLTTQLANRFNFLIDNLTRSKTSKKTINWKDILCTAVRGEIGPHSNINAKSYEELYNKCEKLFSTMRYNYEFESELECEDDIRTEDGGFNVHEYLKTLSNSVQASGQISYKDLVSRYPNDFSQREKEEARFKHNFFKLLGIQDQSLDISCSKTKREPEKKRRKVLVVEPKVEDLNEVKEEILGSVELDENLYMLNL